MKKYIAMLAMTLALFVLTANAAPPKIEKFQKAHGVAKSSEIMKAASTWWFSPTDIGIPVVGVTDISRATKKLAYASDNPATPPVKKKIEAYEYNLLNISEANTSCTIDTSPGNQTEKTGPAMKKVKSADPADTDTSPGAKIQENKAGEKINDMATDIGQR